MGSYLDQDQVTSLGGLQGISEGYNPHLLTFLVNQPDLFGSDALVNAISLGADTLTSQVGLMVGWSIGPRPKWLWTNQPNRIVTAHLLPLDPSPAALAAHCNPDQAGIQRFLTLACAIGTAD